MAETMTLDQATDVVLADEASAGNDVVTYQPEPDIQDEGTLDDQSEGSSDERSLTVDEAAELLADADDSRDDEDAAEQGESERPVAAINGQPLTLTQLVQGFTNGVKLLEQAEGITQQYREVEAAAERVAGAAWALAGLVQQQLPPMPDQRLAHLNPAEYVRREAVFNEGQAVIETMLAQGEQAREAAGVLAGQQHSLTLQNEMRQLVMHFPNCVRKEGREHLMSQIWDAVSYSGFTQDEMRKAVDHRLFRLAALAAVGLTYVQSRERQKPNRQQQRKRNRSRQSAMDRLMESGSIDDALAVDWA